MQVKECRISSSKTKNEERNQQAKWVDQSAERGVERLQCSAGSSHYEGVPWGNRKLKWRMGERGGGPKSRQLESVRSLVNVGAFAHTSGVWT